MSLNTVGIEITCFFFFPQKKIPVAPAVPAVSLVPPAFPVTMSVPPPGYSAIPPPPFLRASFNPSQPPPGKLVRVKLSM